MFKKALIVRFRSRIDVVPIKEIVYLEKDLHRVRVHTKDKVYTFYARFEEIMPYLDVRFRWCHRSYILNYDRIAYLSSQMIRMDDSSELPFGRATLIRLKKDFESYVDWKIEKIREIDEKTGYGMRSGQVAYMDDFSDPDHGSGSDPVHSSGEGPDHSSGSDPDQGADEGPDQGAGEGPDHGAGEGPDQGAGEGPDHGSACSEDR